MWLLKEGTEIHCRELEMVGQAGMHHVIGRGAGRIRLLDTKTGKPVHARWKEQFESRPDGPYDQLILTGNAAFVDDESMDLHDLLDDQRVLRARTFLRADELQVWLEKRPPDAPPAASASAVPDGIKSSAQKVHRIEAAGHVLARSPEMNVHDANFLQINFHDAPPAPAAPPAVAGLAPGPTRSGPTADRPSNAPAPSSPGARPNPASPAKPNQDAKPPRPMDLKAHRIIAFVIRSEKNRDKNAQKNDLDHLWTEGNVHVFQEASGPNAKDGVDIQGDTLRMDRKLGGKELTVTGDMARLKMDTLDIHGPEIHIDQAANTAEVFGDGWMQMETTKDFQGADLAKPVPMEIYWKNSMNFFGEFVEFHGGIQGVQDSSKPACVTNSILGCETLIVTFDHPVSLQEGSKRGESPHPKVITCTDKVKVEEKAVNPAQSGKLISIRQLECAELRMNNDVEKDKNNEKKEEENRIQTSGPGWVRMLQAGGGEPGFNLSGAEDAAKPRPANNSRAEEWNLTMIRYATRMKANKIKRHGYLLGRCPPAALPL